MDSGWAAGGGLGTESRSRVGGNKDHARAGPPSCHQGWGGWSVSLPRVAKTSFSFQCLHRVSAKLEGNETLKVVELDRRVNATF